MIFLIKAIIDTDIGDDIDDALALALALRSPELKVLAVTTIYGRVRLRARLAAKILKAFGEAETPVAMGAPKPLINPEPTHVPNQAPALDPGDVFSNITKKHAADLIVEVLKEEKDVTLITLGPLTNIAIALLKDRDAFKEARLVVMGGCIGRPVLEHNIKADPEAAHVVFTSQLPITLVSLDVTSKCIMPHTALQALKKSNRPPLKVLRRYLDLWTNATKGRPVMHDPLTVAVSFNQELVKKELMHVVVELKGEYTRGLTMRIKGRSPNTEACTDVNVEEFMRLYEDRVLSE